MAQGRGELPEFLNGQQAVLKTLLQSLSESAKDPKNIITSGDVKNPCPNCSAPLIKRKGKHGNFWGCSRYPECKMSMNDKNGKPAPRTDLEISAIDCTICKKNKLIKRKGKKGFWWGCSGYPECRATFFDNGGRPNFDTPQKGKNKERK